ncbi:MAG: cyclic nucleotide-binding domain-containing protein [Tatlockia sp.]|nr:cyclic nucleotide-binding domain-containing protein [Tatlockia sp.]
MTEPIKLEKIPFFKRLTATEILFLAPYIEEKKFGEGEVILPQGSRGGDLYLVISGFVSVDIILPGDYKKKLTQLGVGQVFGEVTFLDDTLVTASVLAPGVCNCLVLSHKTVEMLRMSQPEIAFKIEQEITNQIAVKIIQNIKTILELLKKIPEEPQNPFEHALYLENSSARNYQMKLAEINLSKLIQADFFPKLAQEQRSRLLSLMTIKAYDKGFRFLERIEEPKKFAFIYSGAVMFFIKKNKQLKNSIAVLAVGDLFMQNFLSSELQQLTDYVTCEKSVLLELDMEAYLQLHESDPALFYAISNEINRSIAHSVYITNRQFVRINSEYNNLIL